MLCHSYKRFSHKSQESGDSIQRQEDLLSNWLKRHPEHTLDPITWKDFGVSSFRGKNIKTGDLGKFIQLVKDGKIVSPAILIVESLDRFSRLPPRQALSHFSDLIDHGIIIQTLDPEMTLTAENIDNENMIYPVICTMQRAYEESRIKSNRCKHYWETMRKDKLCDKGHLPAWLKIEDGKPVVNEKVAKSIRYIFQQTIAGVGLQALVKDLNQNFTPITKKALWNVCYIRKTLAERTVIGEFQFYQMNEKGKRIPIGDPIPGYYPAVVDEKTWLQAQSGKSARRFRRGKKADDNFLNLFTGLVVMNDGYKGHIKSIYQKRLNGSRHIQRRWQSWGHRVGKTKQSLTLDYHLFERVVLGALRQIQTNDLFPQKPNGKLQDKREELSGIDEMLKQLAKKLNPTTRNLDAVINQLDTMEEKKETLKREIQELNQLENTAKMKPLEETQSVIEILESDPPMEIKLRLRSLIATLVKEIIIDPTKNGRGKVEAKITISFNHFIYRIVIDTSKNGYYYENVKEHNRQSKKRQIEMIALTNPKFAEVLKSHVA